MDIVVSILGIILGSSLVASVVTSLINIVYQNRIRRIADKKRAYELVLTFLHQCYYEGKADTTELEIKCSFVTLYGSKEVCDKLNKIEARFVFQDNKYSKCFLSPKDLEQLTELIRKDLNVDGYSFAPVLTNFASKYFPFL